MRINQNLFLALSSCLFLLSSQGQTVEPDALTRADAVQQALSQNKMILLIISDTNNCTGCISLEFGTLPSTNKPPMRQFLQESFVYWACGPEQNCTEFRTYTGEGTIALPEFFIIDPHNPQTYTTVGYGDADPLIFYNWLRTGLLKSTKPVVITPQPNETFPDKNIVVQGRSVSTNAAIRGVYYKLNAGAWTYVNAPDTINWQIPLDPTQVADSNVLQVYALDFSQNKSQTNAVTFFYGQGKTPATVTLGGLSYIYDGTAKTATAMTVPAGLTVHFTYNGSATAPINAGSYTVVGTITDPTYQGSTTDTLFIGKATATATLGNLSQVFDGTAKTATATTTPPGLTVNFTYSPSAPINAGSYTVVGTINDPNYQGSATNTLVISPPAPAPVITTLEPNQVKPGSAAFILNVNGSNFVDGSVIRWNGTNQSTTFNSSNGLMALINKSLIASPGLVSITVLNPAIGGGGLSSESPLLVGEPAPAPVIASLDPIQVKPGGAAFILNVNGSNFVDGSIIRWNGTNQSTTFNSGNSLMALINKSLIASPGSVSITVFNPGPGGGGLSFESLVLTISDTVVTPKMTLGRTDNIITIGWPTNGFKLQSTPVLPATNWQDVAGSETANSLSVPIGIGNQFYRLMK